MCFFDPKLDIWGQKSIFCLVIAIFVGGTNVHYTRGYNFPIGTTPKKISVSELGVIFGAHPCFWPFLAIPTLEVQLPLILVRFQQNWGEPSRPSKKMTQKDNGLGPGQNYGETGIFTFSRKVVFGLKMGLTPKNHPK